MSHRPEKFRSKSHLWLIRALGVIVPRRLRADWRQEWEAELRYRESLLAEWDNLFTAAVSALTGVLFGLAPALRATRIGLTPMLKETPGAGDATRSRLIKTLLVAQVAMSLVLLTGAGLFVRTLRKHQPLIMNWFKAKKAYSCGVVEGMNRKINLVTRKSFGFRSFDVLKIALFHTMGDLPEPEFTHRFC